MPGTTFLSIAGPAGTVIALAIGMIVMLVLVRSFSYLMAHSSKTGGVFEGIDDLFQEQMSQKGIDFSIHSSQLRDRFIWCDRKSLNHVLLNLVSNAYKFTPSGGTIEMLTSPGSGTEIIIRLKFRKADEDDVTAEGSRNAPTRTSWWTLLASDCCWWRTTPSTWKSPS